MTTRGWEAVHVDDLDAIPVAEGVVWHPLRRRLGIRAFGTNVYTSEGVGQHIVEDHDELGSGAGGHEEMYVVLRGRAKFTIDGEDARRPGGHDRLHPRPGPEARRVRARRRARSCWRSAASRAAPTRSRRGSTTSPRSRCCEAERWDEAIAVLEAGLREHPSNASLLYNLACAESQAGRTVEALTHLQEAIRRNPPYRRDARGPTRTSTRSAASPASRRSAPMAVARRRSAVAAALTSDGSGRLPAASGS